MLRAHPVGYERRDGLRDPAGGDPATAHETRDEQLDRNWDDLLQELRVMQTGVQLLAGFLVTLPFQTRLRRASTTTSARLYLCAPRRWPG